MELSLNSRRFLGIMIALFMLTIFLLPEIAEARRGGGGRSFGGSRRSFSSPSRTTSKPSSSFSRQRSGSSSSNQTRSSMGGTRMSSSKDYTSKYGTPRKTDTRSMRGADGVSRNYQFNSYGGFGSGLMMGYMLGAAPWYWSMPFHGAFYYSRPYQVTNPDGTVSVYPPTFSWSKFLFTLMIVAILIYLIRAYFKRRRNGYASNSSGGGGGSGSYSSFG